MTESAVMPLDDFVLFSCRIGQLVGRVRVWRDVQRANAPGVLEAVRVAATPRLERKQILLLRTADDGAERQVYVCCHVFQFEIHVEGKRDVGRPAYANADGRGKLVLDQTEGVRLAGLAAIVHSALVARGLL